MAQDSGQPIRPLGLTSAQFVEAEEDRVEEAPGIKRSSRLACQCELKDLGEGKRTPIVIRVPSWNRNAVKEIPH